MVLLYVLTWPFTNPEKPNYAMSADDLRLKYRPKSLRDVIGQGEIATAVKAVVEAGRSRSFLFTGPSGCGKTTIARIIAAMVDVTSENLIEVDAASKSGVNDIKELTASLRFKALGRTNQRVFIIDECHSLSSQAWQSLLKSIEEPPPGVHWIFCTTEAHKVPPTIKNRCSAFTLKNPTTKELRKLLEGIVREEKMEMSVEVIEVAVEAAEGSPRQAITNLMQIMDCDDADEAESVLEMLGGPSDGVRVIISELNSVSPSWRKLMGAIQDMGYVDHEGSRRQICAYYAAVLTKAAKPDLQAMAVLDAFKTPYPTKSGAPPLILSLGELLIGGEEEVPF